MRLRHSADRFAALHVTTKTQKHDAREGVSPLESLCLCGWPLHVANTPYIGFNDKQLVALGQAENQPSAIITLLHTISNAAPFGAPVLLVLAPG